MGGGSYIKTLVPGGARGVALKSNAPLSAAHAEIRGLKRAGRR